MTTPLPFPQIETPRLLLREIGVLDVPALFDIHSNADAMRWFGSDPITDLQGAARLVETFAGWRKTANPGTRWGIQKKSCSTLIGTCGLFKWNRSWNHCMLGYELSPQAQGSGLMGEALRAVLSWGFEHMQLNRIEALIHPDNAASVRSVERLGFVREGTLRQLGRWGGEYHDMLQYSLLAQEWDAGTARAG